MRPMLCCAFMPHAVMVHLWLADPPCSDQCAPYVGTPGEPGYATVYKAWNGKCLTCNLANCDVCDKFGKSQYPVLEHLSPLRAPY